MAEIRVGATVRIKKGPLAGKTGVFKGVNPGGASGNVLIPGVGLEKNITLSHIQDMNPGQKNAEDEAVAEDAGSDDWQQAQDWFGKLPEEERSRIIESSGFTGGPGILPVEAIMAAWKASQGATAHAERPFASFSETGLGLNANRPGFAKSRLQ